VREGSLIFLVPLPLNRLTIDKSETFVKERRGRFSIMGSYLHHELYAGSATALKFDSDREEKL